MARKRKKKQKGPGVWVTSDGRKLPVSQMTDKHLLNTIEYLRRRIAEVEKTLDERIYHQSSLVASDFDDWEFKRRSNPLNGLRADMNMVQAEYDRRHHIVRRDAVISQKVRIEFEGPGLIAREV